MSQPQVLIVIDVQNGFRNPAMPPSNNPACEDNVRRLLALWRERNWPVVLVRHDSKNPSSVLAPGQQGNDLQPGIDGAHNLLVSKSVNSAFYGEPDLKSWLEASNYKKLVICGIQTNYCCETTARMAGNLGYEVDFVLDATRTFDLNDSEGAVVTADTLSKITAVNLDGEFATVVSTDSVISGSGDL
jgi:nicotinamidase-related amidase